MKYLLTKILSSPIFPLIVALLVCPSCTRTGATRASHLFDVAWDDRAIFRQGLVDEAQEALDRLPGASVYHIEFQISDDLLTLRGREEIRYTNQEDEPLGEVYLRLFPNIAGGAAKISKVKIDDLDLEPIYEFQDSAILVPLPEALQPGEQMVIQMDFDVEMPQEVGESRGLFGYFDGALILDEFYPVIPVYDDEGWNVEGPLPHGDVTYFDASFYLVRVIAPENLVIVATGVQVEREFDGDDQILTFAAGPARDFYLVASEHYTVISERVGETTFNSYTFPGREEGAELALQFAVNGLQGFGERFGSYPYTEFDVVGAPMKPLGMEYPGVMAVSLELYGPETIATDSSSQALLEVVVAHEAAHQWFYNMVGNDQIDEPWLDEALAQYATGLYQADVHGEHVAQKYRDGFWYGFWDSVKRAEIPVGLSAKDYTEDEFAPIVYGRGPIFVATLAEEMGHETFDEFLRDYVASQRWGIGTGDSFRQLAERHCQCDLTALFQEWVYEE
jgi:hypothetical protein